jgi:glycopeptide antibiotics resistance protein
VAVIIFPVITFVAACPYVIHQYRKSGALLAGRSILFYGFILYGLCAFFLTILPLPSIEEVRQMTDPYLRLVPFRAVMDWLQHTGFSITDPSTYAGALFSADLFVTGANVLLTLPLGFFLGYMFRLNWKQVLLISFLTSLFFELVQLSGVFFIYPRPYRIADVDDLISNTLGGMLGYVITRKLLPHLPDLDRAMPVGYGRGDHVSVVRRAMALFIDWLILIIPATGLYALLVLGASFTPNAAAVSVIFVCVILYFVLFQWLRRGQTLGKAVVRIRVTGSAGRVGLGWLFLREMVLYGVFILAPLWGLGLFGLARNPQAGHPEMFTLLGSCAFALSTVLAIHLVLYMCNHEKPLWHERISRTRTISTLGRADASSR